MQRPVPAPDWPRPLCSALALVFAAAMVRPAAAATTAARPGWLEAAPQLKALIEADWADRDLRFSGGPDGGRREVGTTEDAAGGCDGIKTGRWGFHTASNEQDPWWQVDLGKTYRLDRIVVYNRTDRGTAPRTRRLRILVAGDECKEFRLVYEHPGEVFYGVKEGKPLVVRFADRDVRARIVRLQVPGRCSFALDEVEVYPAETPETNVALHQPADQKSVGPYSYPGTLPPGVDSAPLPGRGSPQFTLAHTRRVLDQARELAARLSDEGADAARLAQLAERLERLSWRLGVLERAGETPPLEVRRRIHMEARWLARRIAFCNPLLQSIDKLLFVKRHDPGGVFHMCDQYYGCNARPGGGLFVLHDPFGDHPRLQNLLAGRVVEKGRLKGDDLSAGSFLSPEVSFDGQTIFFAYTQCQATETYTWAPEYSYHIFRVNADGSGLVQLTDGPWDDFDPCELPNGRIVFVSERRGGYLRCGRHCPTYAMFSMNRDGGDIVPVSYHETHEWHPSVTNDGMIVYTRWDYVDRDTNIAHHIWTCYPDGRDPRSPHGNYPVRREGRPWMEMSIRAIPNSPKFVATAASHHGNAFGSLVIIDPRIVDDGAASQLTRLTPDAPFPEAEGGKANIRRNMKYGTAWPLSENDFLCVYDYYAKNRGIYWIDRFGNRELIYRDPEISCLSPIPLRPRPRPPIIPDRTALTAAGRAAGAVGPATIAVMNVYDSDFQWPDDARITALRIIQLLPKTTPPPNEPRIGVADQTNARAVLGTVPVEPDGSAYFEAPPGKELYFQALDERGMAVMSMRSGTYVHPGEQLTCQGCHERKGRPPAPRDVPPLALLREPSKIEPDVDGSNPFNFVRLVQPVLDRRCADCHRERQALDLSNAIEGPYGWTRSYTNLAGKYGFYFNVRNGSINDGAHGGSRTIPGRFGARAAPLLDYLGPQHYGVQLTPEEFHRITLWLDCNSEFYGSYENTAAQARGAVVWPTLD